MELATKTVKIHKDKATMRPMSDLVARATSKGFIAPREVINQIERLAPEAVDTIQDLMRHSKTDSVRLKAAVHLLELGGVTRETRLTIKTDVAEMSEKEINDRLSRLMGEATGVLLEHDKDEEDEDE